MQMQVSSAATGEVGLLRNFNRCIPRFRPWGSTMRTEDSAGPLRQLAFAA
jgi:hypothetical protein